MKVTSDNSKHIRIIEIQGLDPIDIFIAHERDNGGQMTIACEGNAFTCHWGAIAGSSIIDFVLSCDIDYLSNKFFSVYFKEQHRTRIYIEKVIKAVKEGLKMYKEDKQKDTKQ